MTSIKRKEITMQTQQLIKVAVAQCDYPSQPRSRLDPDYCLRLGQNMLEHGQKVPVIGYFSGDRFIICDGGCRLEGIRLAGIPDVLALDLGKEPTALGLLVSQASIDVYHQHLPPIDRARLFRSICKEQGCTGRQLAKTLHVSEGFICRALALLELPEDLQAQINDGSLDASRGYLLSQESDPERQRQLAADAMSVSREELGQRVRRQKGQSATPQVRAKRIVCPLPSGVSVTVAGQDLSLDDVIRALDEAHKAAKKGREQKNDVKTWQRVMLDKSRAP